MTSVRFPFHSSPNQPKEVSLKKKNWENSGEENLKPSWEKFWRCERDSEEFSKFF